MAKLSEGSPLYEELMVPTTIPAIPPSEDSQDFATEEQEVPIVSTEHETETKDISSSIGNLISNRLAEAEASKSGTKRTRKSSSDSSSSGGVTPGGRVVQPKRSRKKVDEDRLYDGTQLHASHHGYFVHRDYAAHFFKWGFVARLIKPGQRVLDVGSGEDLPLPRVISAPNVFKNCAPSKVVCVDWNSFETKFNPSWLEVHTNFDFTLQWGSIVGSYLSDGRWVPILDSMFDVITCLEVIEHMDKEAGDRLLTGILGCLRQNGIAIISTPVFNGLAAANHIYEYGLEELYHKLIANGLTPVQRYGTFANINDLRKVCTDSEKELMEVLSQYYANDVLSCFFAPKYPDASRNNVWVCMRTVDLQVNGGQHDMVNHTEDDYINEELGRESIMEVNDVTDLTG